MTFVVKVAFLVLGVKVEGQTFPLKFAPPATQEQTVRGNGKIRSVDDNISG